MPEIVSSFGEASIHPPGDPTRRTAGSDASLHVPTVRPTGSDASPGVPRVVPAGSDASPRVPAHWIGGNFVRLAVPSLVPTAISFALTSEASVRTGASHVGRCDAWDRWKRDAPRGPVRLPDREGRSPARPTRRTSGRDAFPRVRTVCPTRSDASLHVLLAVQPGGTPSRASGPSARPGATLPRASHASHRRERGFPTRPDHLPDRERGFPARPDRLPDRALHRSLRSVRFAAGPFEITGGPRSLPRVSRLFVLLRPRVSASPRRNSALSRPPGAREPPHRRCFRSSARTQARSNTPSTRTE